MPSKAARPGPANAKAEPKDDLKTLPMAEVERRLQSSAEGITQAEIVRWNFQEGQRVTPDDDLVELVTDKAVFNVPAPAAGTITCIHYREGSMAPVGAFLAQLD